MYLIIAVQTGQLLSNERTGPKLGAQQQVQYVLKLQAWHPLRVVTFFGPYTGLACMHVHRHDSPVSWATVGEILEKISTLYDNMNPGGCIRGHSTESIERRHKMPADTTLAPGPSFASDSCSDLRLAHSLIYDSHSSVQSFGNLGMAPDIQQL